MVPLFFQELLLTIYCRYYSGNGRFEDERRSNQEHSSEGNHYFSIFAEINCPFRPWKSLMKIRSVTLFRSQLICCKLWSVVTPITRYLHILECSSIWFSEIEFRDGFSRWCAPKYSWNGQRKVIERLSRFINNHLQLRDSAHRNFVYQLSKSLEMAMKTISEWEKIRKGSIEIKVVNSSCVIRWKIFRISRNQ